MVVLEKIAYLFDSLAFDICICVAKEIDHVDVMNENTVFLDEYRGIYYDMIMNERYNLQHNAVNLCIYNFGKARYGLPVNRLSPYYGKTIDIEGFANHRGILTNYQSPFGLIYTTVGNIDKPFVSFFELFAEGFWRSLFNMILSYSVKNFFSIIKFVFENISTFIGFIANFF